MYSLIIKKKIIKENNNIEKLRYYEYITNNILYKYALRKIYNNNNTIYYICADTHCKGRLKVQYNFNLNDTTIEKYEIKNVELTNEHNLDIEEHNYYINNQIKQDLKYKAVTYLQEKKNNINYLINIIKEEGLKNQNVDSTVESLYNFIKNKYADLKLNYKSLSKHIYFKKQNNIEHLNEEDYKKVITLKTLCAKLNSYIKYYIKKNNTLHNGKQKNNNRRGNSNIFYKKTIYLFLIDEMKKI